MISDETNSEIIQTLTEIGIIEEFTFSVYLLNLAWDGFCRSNGFDSYEVAPFNNQDKNFAQYWWDKLLSGGKFELDGYSPKSP